MTGSASARRLVPAGDPSAVARRHVVTALVLDRPGTLNRVSGLLRARSFNIESLNVGTTHEPGRSRMTIALRGDDGHLRQVLAQLERLIDVLEVEDLTTAPHVEVELALAEVDAPADGDAVDALQAVLAGAGGRVIGHDARTWCVQLSAATDRIDRAVAELDRFGLRCLVRTGAVAIAADAGSTTPLPPSQPQNGASPA